ncbi:MAG: ABC transporter ATP-binding protein [Acidobacteriia bacterium]|nr:ABC transporter ATP-binding protein [Terriglobia bacterium]
MKSYGPLLSARISADYPNKPGVLRDVSLDIYPGEVLGLVGQSGSGKSTIALALMKLLAFKGGRVNGRMTFNGRDLMPLSESEMRKVRGREISLVLQSPLSSLNPALKISTQLEEAWRAHSGSSAAECRAAIVRSLASVSLPYEDEFLQRYSGQISVGQAQRVLIAMAVLHCPALLIADEATSSLDVITQSEILNLFAKLNRERGMGVLYISHDLLSVASICHRIAILSNGEIVECDRTERIFSSPSHPYTQQLIAALPTLPQQRENADQREIGVAFRTAQ